MQLKALGFGAIVWDDIKDTPTTGTVRTACIDGEESIGGAVLNVLAHLVKLGGSASMCSAVGMDRLGDKTLQQVACLKIGTEFIKKVQLPTPVIRVTFEDPCTPEYVIPDTATWDAVEITEHDLATINAQHYDYFCFGTLEQRASLSEHSLDAILERCSFRDVMLDMTLRGAFYNRRIIEKSIRRSTIIKMNEGELAILGDLLGFRSVPPEQGIQALLASFREKYVCVTLGGQGSYLGHGQELVHAKAYPTSVCDTVGAGDAYSAGLLHGLYHGYSLQETADFASRLAALICSKKSSIPDYALAEIATISSVPSAAGESSMST